MYRFRDENRAGVPVRFLSSLSREHFNNFLRRIYLDNLRSNLRYRPWRWRGILLDILRDWFRWQIHRIYANLDSWSCNASYHANPAGIIEAILLVPVFR